ASSVTVMDILDSRLTFQSCSITCNRSGNTVTVNLGSISAGTTSIFTINAMAPTVTSQTSISNTATVATTTPESDTSNNQSPQVNTTVNPPAVVSPTCTLSANPATITQGQSSTLTWTTANNPTSASINNNFGPVNP